MDRVLTGKKGEIVLPSIQKYSGELAKIIEHFN